MVQNSWRQAAKAAAATLALGLATTALGATQRFALADHPDAAKDPPPYGLRLDNVFANAGLTSTTGQSVSGVTTFSFSHPSSSMFLDVTETPLGGGGLDITIHIFGQAYGGVDTGGSYGFGEGLYTIDFTYSANVLKAADGWFVDPQSVQNQGSVVAGAGITDVPAGTTFQFFEQTPTGNPFRFESDGHRLGGFPTLLVEDPFVGRGWLTFNSDGSDAAGTQDWLFVGRPIPLPTPLGLACVGLGATLLRRSGRRR